MKIVLIALLIGLSHYSNAYADEKYDDLSRRIKELEIQQEQLFLQMSEPKPQVSSFLNDNLSLGGFFEPAYTIIDGPDTKTQALNSSNTLGLNIATEYESNFRFVSQVLTGLTVPLQNPNNDPTATPSRREFTSYFFGALLTQGYIEYSKNRKFNIQGGLGYVPFGYANQQRELVLFIRRGGPQILRTSSLVAPLWSGVHIYGSMPYKKNEMGYNLYTFTPPTYTQTPGIGGRFWMADANENLIAGLSTQVGKSTLETFKTVGADLRWDFFPFSLRTEYVYYFSKENDPWSFYLEPSVFIVGEEVLLYAFGDYSNNPLNQTGSGATATLDPYQKWEYGFGVNWLPTSFTRFRVGLTLNDYVGATAKKMNQDRDYYALDISAGVAF